jgi:hypothetical protein
VIQIKSVFTGSFGKKAFNNLIYMALKEGLEKGKFYDEIHINYPGCANYPKGTPMGQFLTKIGKKLFGADRVGVRIELGRTSNRMIATFWYDNPSYLK